MSKTTYLVIARMAGNFAMLGDTKDKTETIELQVQAPMCLIHDRPMVLMHGRRGPFWSCHQKSKDGTWCDYRPDETI
jgi:hypothetical protein